MFYAIQQKYPLKYVFVYSVLDMVSDGEVPVLVLSGMESTPSLPLLSGVRISTC